ncbi:MAG TPA: glycosyltransferase family 39 protein [Anaerolineales bacterium]|nr:glycosyltransferase family 39 protein [Anaerolineales bacterium]
MNDQPSLLDLLKSLLNPRRTPLRIKDLLEEEPTASMGVPTVQAPPRGEPNISPPEEIPGRPPAVDPAAVPLVRDAAAALPFEQAHTGRMPWRTLAGLAIAVIGQSGLEQAGRRPEVGIWFYLAAVVLIIWAYRSGELSPARAVMVSEKEEGYLLRSRLLWTALPALLVAFLAFGGNRFTAFNLVLWLGGLLLFVLALWEFRTGLPGAWRRTVAWLRPPYAFRITPWHFVVAAGIVLVLFFRFYRLSEVPAEMFSDHAEKLQDVQAVLNGETQIFFPRNTGREFVQMYLTAFTAQVLGFDLTFMALKMGTALAGLVTLPYIYLLGSEIANKQVGLLAAVLAGISYWLNVITRVALRFSLYPLFVAPVLYHLVRGLRRRDRNDFIFAGIFLGLGLHGYSPFRFVPILVVLVVVLFVLHRMNREDSNRAGWHLAILALVSLIVFLPLLRFMTESPDNMLIVMYRSMTRISTVETDFPGNPALIFLDNLGKAMTMFAWDNGNTWVHSVPLRPALDVITAPLFYLGFFLLIYRYLTRRRWEDGVLLIAVPMLVLPSAMSLAFPAENPSLNRTGGAIVPVFLIAALALEAILRAIKDWLPGKRGRWAAWFAGIVLLAVTAQANYDLVFVRYDSQFRASAWNTSELGSVIRGFADSIGSEDRAWVIPWPHWVDTRLVGINAGVYIRDYAIPRELLAETVPAAGPMLFLLHIDDVETLTELYRLYPDGVESRYVSETPGKDFIVFLAVAR